MRSDISRTENFALPVTTQESREPDGRILGYVVEGLEDIESRVRALRPGETLHLHPDDDRRTAVVEVQDDSWRRGIDR